MLRRSAPTSVHHGAGSDGGCKAFDWSPDWVIDWVIDAQIEKVTAGKTIAIAHHRNPIPVERPVAAKATQREPAGKVAGVSAARYRSAVRPPAPSR
jgi:hypothetical protein